MANHDGLDLVFSALSDPTRRAVVSALATRPRSVSELAGGSSMALPSFLKHLGVLERAGLTTSEKVGRSRIVTLRPRSLATAGTWIDQQEAFWKTGLDRLAARLEK